MNHPRLKARESSPRHAGALLADAKAVVVLRLGPLELDVLRDDIIRDLTAATPEVAACPQVPSIDLTPEQQRVLDLAVRSGAYQNPDEVIDQAFAIIREQLDFEDWMLEQREGIATHVAAGFAQAERGELIDGDEALAVLRRRRAERLKPQG